MQKIISNLPNSAMDGWDGEFNPANFLFKMNCFLKDFVVQGLFAPNIINHYAQAYKLNQRIILMTLQKEQGLIEKTYAPEPAIMDKACGVGILEKGEIIEKFKGFENQIKSCVATYRHHFDTWEPGKIAILTNGHGVEVGGVECQTSIAYALLRYTPSINALHLAEDVYHRYFPGYLI